MRLTDKVKLKSSVDLFSDLTPVLSVSLITIEKCGRVTFTGSDGYKRYPNLEAADYEVVWSSRK